MQNIVSLEVVIFKILTEANPKSAQLISYLNLSTANDQYLISLIYYFQGLLSN